ncbi:hypothetical protein [Campylobacter rectus]|uniref:hypothetical protein n=1 Tax=Campylobacter rectus TaxID=203 RepID=UPI0023F4DD90|nr:hypothetical protein [Campylobacter rectus]
MKLNLLAYDSSKNDLDGIAVLFYQDSSQTACPYVATGLVAGITATMVISFAKPNELIAAKK